MSTTYSVVLALSTTGSLDAKIGAVGSAVDRAGAGVQRLGDSAKTMGSNIEAMGAKVGDAVTSIMDKVASVGLSIAKWGGAAALGGIVYGVGALNSQLEQTENSFAAIFNAQGLTKSFNAGLTVAAEQIDQMKVDVRTLPGTFGQLAQLMQTTATTGIAAGMDADALRKFSGRTMLTASIVAPTIDNNLLSKEIVNLLAGKAGTHNILGLRLGLQGDEAKKFNALAPEARLAALNKIYDKYADATDAISHSWKAQWTTLKDNALYSVLQPATAGLFDHVFKDLETFNAYFDKNRDKVVRFVTIIGDDLSKAWGKVVDVAIKLEPVFENMARHLERMTLREMVSDAKKLGIEMLAIRALPGIISGGFGIGKMLSSAGGAVAAGGASAAEAGFFGAAGAAELSGGGGAAAGGAVMGGPVAWAAVAVAVVALAGIVDNIAEKASEFHDSSVGIWNDIKKSGGELWSALGDVVDRFKPLARALGEISLETISIGVQGITLVVKAINELLIPLEYFGRAVQMVTPGYKSPVSSTGEVLRGDYAHHKQSEYGEALDASLRALEKRPSPTTTIQKVEIVVKGSDDPTRVARLTLETLLRTVNQKQQLKSSFNPSNVR